MLACRGGAQDATWCSARCGRPYAAKGPTRRRLWTLVDGTGRLGIACAAPVLRHVYRETSSSHLRGRAARALAATDPSFAAGFAVECLWDCEETTREVAARHAETGDVRVVDQLRRLAADPAEEAEVQTAVRSRIGPDMPADDCMHAVGDCPRRPGGRVGGGLDAGHLPGVQRNAHGTFPVRKDPR